MLLLSLAFQESQWHVRNLFCQRVLRGLLSFLQLEGATAVFKAIHFWIQDESHLALIYLIKKNQMLEWNSHVHLPVQVFQLNDEIGENLVQARQF